MDYDKQTCWDTNATCVAKALAFCLKKKKNFHWTDEWYSWRSCCTYEDHVDIKVNWGKQLQNFLQLDVQSFDELLKTVTLTVTKRNTNLQEAVTSSQCFSITLCYLATRNPFWRHDIYKCCISLVHWKYHAGAVYAAR
jgi:hypothetical protein